MKVGRTLLWLAGGSVLGFLVLPLPIIFPMSLSRISYFKFPPELLSWQWYTKFLTTPIWLQVIQNTLVVGAIATGLAVVLGTLVALALTRANFRGHRLLASSILTPMVLSPIVMALGQYKLLSALDLIGARLGLGLVHTVLVLPFVFVCVATSLQAQDPLLPKVAESLGAGPVKAFFSVTLPLILPGILSGAIFAFMISFDELILAIYMSGVHARTLPLQMWDGIRQEVTPEIAVAATFILLSYLVLFLLYDVGVRLASQRRKRGHPYV